MTMVIAQHCGLLPFGWIGVWLFYVISGFVICRTLLTEAPAPAGVQYSRFIVRRFYRIVPVYLLYILINIGVMAAVGRYGSLRDVPFLLTFTYNWQMIFRIWDGPGRYAAFAHLWTLSVEEQFYLFFPVMLLWLPRRWFPGLTLIIILAMPLVRFLFSRWVGTLPAAADPGWAAYAVYAASFTQFDAFLIGALLAKAEPHLSGSRYRAMLPIAAATLTAAYVVTYVLVNYAQGARGIDMVRNVFSGTMTGQFREVFVYTVIDLAAASAVLHVTRGGWGTRLLASRPFLLVGRVSYGGYLFHALILLLMADLLQISPMQLQFGARFGYLAVVWSLTVLLAYVSFTWFEARIISWSRGHASRRALGTDGAVVIRANTPTTQPSCK